jgi:hypothetical protein
MTDGGSDASEKADHEKDERNSEDAAGRGTLWAGGGSKCGSVTVDSDRVPASGKDGGVIMAAAG